MIGGWRRQGGRQGGLFYDYDFGTILSIAIYRFFLSFSLLVFTHLVYSPCRHGDVLMTISSD